MTPLRSAALLVAIHAGAATAQEDELVFSDSPLAAARAGHSARVAEVDFGVPAAAEPPAEVFQHIRYRSPAGELSAYLTPDPGDGEKHPAIVWAHGGFGGLGPWAWEPGTNAQAFLDAGLVVCMPSWRGENDNPGTFELFYGEVDDLVAAVEHVAALPWVDPERVYLAGHSTGGTLTLLAALSTDKVRAAFSFGGAPDVYAVVEDGEGYGNTPYDHTDVKESWLRSALYFVRTLETPTYYFEGELAPFYLPHAERMQAEANAAEAPFRAFTMEGGDHFDIVAPLTTLIADEILSATPDEPLVLTDDEIAEAWAARPRVHDLSLGVNVGEPILCRIESRARGEVTTRVGGGAAERRTIEHASEVEFVDEYTTLDDDGWTATRTYTRWTSEQDGRATDPEFNGARVLYSQDEQVEVELDGDRQARRAEIEALLEQAEFVGVWFGLPTDAVEGEPFWFDAASMLHALFDLKLGELQGHEAVLRIDSVDEDWIASLSGHVRCETVEEETGVAIRTAFAGEWTMRVDIPNGRLLELELEGTAEATSESDAVELTGSLDCEVRLTTEIGRPVQQALRRKPVFRPVPRALDEIGVDLELESDWFFAGPDDKELVFQTCLEGEPVHLALTTIAISEGEHEAVIDAAIDKIRADVGEVDVDGVRAPLGRGSELRFSTPDAEFLVALYPLGPDKLLRARLWGAPDALAEQAKGWPRIRKSLALLERR